jgi:signal transduction histidine kinase
LLGSTSNRNLTLSIKLIFGFLVVAIPSVAIMGGISFYALRDLAGVNNELQEISRSLEAVRVLEAAFSRAVTPLSEFVISGKDVEVQSFNGLIDQVEARLRTCAEAACHGAARQPSEMASSLVPYLQGIRQRAEKLLMPVDLDSQTEKAQLLREINNLAQHAHRQLERMSSTLLTRVESLQRKSRELNQRMRRLMIASMLMVVAIAIMTAYFISRRLLKPVHELLAGTRHVKEGDWAYRVPIIEKDEFGELAQSFNVMAEEIQEHRKHLEKTVETKTVELQQAQDSLLQSEKLASIGLLAAGVAHELNNPLTSILMNINLLMEEVENEPRLYNELKHVSEDTIRCKRIIDDLRDFSRGHKLEVQTCDLNQIVRKTLGLIAHELTLRDIEVFEELDTRMPGIECDPARIQQVLMNVFVNALQAMPRGGSLTVRTEIRDNAAEAVVQDTGCGVASEIKSKIFDPFFTTKQDGTGLGLSLVYRIMEEHEGSVTIENVARAGSGRTEISGAVVRLRLPLRVAHQRPSSALASGIGKRGEDR